MFKNQATGGGVPDPKPPVKPKGTTKTKGKGK